MLLALDTSTRFASIALYDEFGVQGELTWRVDQNHTEDLMPRVVDLMAGAHVTPASLTGVAVALGPGSFNGLRVALSAAKGLAGEVILRKKQMRDACTSAVHQHMVNQRETLANELEQYFANKGIYVEIELNGTDKTSLRVSSTALRVTSINRIADETAFFSHLKRVGFTSIAFDNSNGGVKIYKLES